MHIYGTYSMSCTHKHVSGVLWEVYCMKPATKVIELVTQVSISLPPPLFFTFIVIFNQSLLESPSGRAVTHSSGNSINASVNLESSYIYSVPFTIPMSLYIRVEILQLYFFTLLLMPEGSIPNKPFLDLESISFTLH